MSTRPHAGSDVLFRFPLLEMKSRVDDHGYPAKVVRTNADGTLNLAVFVDSKSPSRSPVLTVEDVEEFGTPSAGGWYWRE